MVEGGGVGFMATATATPASTATTTRIATPNEPIAGQLAEYHVFSELLKRGVAIYQPLVNEGIDALVRLLDGQILELAIKSVSVPAEQRPRRFQMPDYQPRPEFFIVCVDLSEGTENIQTWVFPSLVFYAYSPGAGSERKNRILNLDSGEKKYDAPLWDYLRGFRNRWELIADFAKFRGFMDSPEGFIDLEDLVTAKESFEQPEENKIPWEEYVRSVTEKVSS